MMNMLSCLQESLFLGIQFTDSDIKTAIYNNHSFVLLEPIALPEQFRLFYGAQPSQAFQLAQQVDARYHLQQSEICYDQKPLVQHFIVAVKHLYDVLREQYPSAEFKVVLAIPAFYTDHQRALLLKTFKALNLQIV